MAGQTGTSHFLDGVHGVALGAAVLYVVTAVVISISDIRTMSGS